jgi:hypothetical protein
MLTAILVTLIIVVALGVSLQSDKNGTLISHTPYNNPHSDASGAREDHLG